MIAPPRLGSNPLFLFLTLVVSALSTHPAIAKAVAQLEIYFIDVEGGQSTLIVTPDRHSFLIDAGWAGNGTGFVPGPPHLARDANRIVAAAHDAGIQRIDYLLITHFHADHDGGVSELSQLMPIHTFIDHGVPGAQAVDTSEETKSAFDAYATVRREAAEHLEPLTGDRLPPHDIEVTVVSSGGWPLKRPLSQAGATNASCHDEATPPQDPYENPRSTGIVVRFGKFRFLDLGDLSGKPLYDLACPRDFIGPVDAYLVAHHGGPDVADPATFAAFKPRVAIMNNGLNKGGARTTYEALHHVSGLEDVWQLHASADAADSNFPAPHIANLDESTAYWIKLTAHEDGSFQVLNPRTGESKSYAPRAN
jgi:competence protein ComEC